MNFLGNYVLSVWYVALYDDILPEPNSILLFSMTLSRGGAYFGYFCVENKSLPGASGQNLEQVVPSLTTD